MSCFFIFIFFFTYQSTYSQDSLVYNEEFNNNDNYWLVWDGIKEVKRRRSKNIKKIDTDKSLEIANGHYKLFNDSWDDVYSWQRIYVLNPNKDFVIETKIRQIDGDDDEEFGFIWGYKNNENGNNFYINSEKEFAISSVVNGNEVELVDWEDADIINEMGEYNVLKVEKKNRNYYYYINDSLVYEQTMTLNLNNFFAFFIEDDITIEIDYLRIYQEREPINLIDNPVNGFVKMNLGDSVNSNGAELLPIISADGKILYFVLDGENTAYGRQDIMYSELLDDSTFSKATNLTHPINNEYSNGVISMSTDKNKLYLISNYEIDGKFESGIAYSVRDNSGWSYPKRTVIKDLVHYGRYVSYNMSSDNQILLSTLINDESKGRSDLYVSFLKDGGFTKPLNLGSQINSYEDESTPFLAADNKTLYFASYSHSGYGDADIFISKRLDDTWQNWSKPKNLGSEINSKEWDSYYSISASGEYAYLVSNKDSIAGSDIYRIKLTKDAKPEPVALVKGRIIDTKTDKPISANVEYKDIKTDSLMGTAISDPIEGKYQITLPMGRNYIFSAEKDGFYSMSQTVFIDSLEEYTEIEQDLKTTPLEIGASILLNSIFFEYNKDILKDDSYSELNKLHELLTKYPNMKIEIAGFTDNIGSVSYNERLSGARAKQVFDYLVTKGIPQENISSVGYGKHNPVADNSTEEGRAQNRRVEFVIIDK